MGGDVTELLQRARAGDRPARDELWPLLFADLQSNLVHA